MEKAVWRDAGKPERPKPHSHRIARRQTQEEQAQVMRYAKRYAGDLLLGYERARAHGYTRRKSFGAHVAVRIAYLPAGEAGQGRAVSDTDGPDGQRGGVHQRIAGDKIQAQDFEEALIEMGIEYHRIQIAPRAITGRWSASIARTGCGAASACGYTVWRMGASGWLGSIPNSV